MNEARKAELSTGTIIISAFVVILAGLILVFGFRQISSLKSSASEKELNVFASKLQGSLEKYSTSPYGIGSSNKETLQMPSGVESICFVDHSKKFKNIGVKELNTYMRAYPGSNVFFAPFSKITPKKLDYMQIAEEDNPLCINAKGPVLEIQLITQGDSAMIKAVKAEEKKEPCKSLVYNSKPEQSYDIVFLGDAFTEIAELRKEADKYINDVFYAVEPFSSNKDKLNFYMVNELPDLGCMLGAWASCDELKVQKAASSCPNDYIVVLIARSKILDFVKPVRSSSIANMATINTADNQMVVMHEFGHAFANLADEYVDDNYYGRIKFDAKRYPNCDSSGCGKWKNIEGAECLKGCSTSGFYRATETSVMKSLKSGFYGPVNEKEILKSLNKYKGAEG